MIPTDSPGVVRRPFASMCDVDDLDFNEVFFNDVRIPVDWLLGEQNNGWRQATAMLMYERVAIGSMGSGSISQPMYDTLVQAATEAGRIGDPVVRDRLMRIYAMETTKSLVALRTRAELKAGKAPGPGGSLGKLATSMISRQFRDVALEIAGPGSQAWPADRYHDGDLQQQMISSFSAGIAGGTDEIQRNIIGDRVLGLPRDISVDTNIPFKDLKVGTQGR
jgi:alkylation response protein AidB-like acyl-CoA dehydrogenase